MAEDEIIKKHTEAVINAVKDKEKSWLHKLREIGQEIAIIVFAVSLSIWFHSWAEDRKDRREEKEFYEGLKADLQQDLAEMKSDQRALQSIDTAVNYFIKARDAKADPDQLSKNSWIFFSDIQMNPRVGRYEALKSSGRLDIIQDKKLLYQITDLYEKLFPAIFRTNETYNHLAVDELANYLGDVVTFDSTGRFTNMDKVIRSPKMILFLGRFKGNTDNCDSVYTRGINGAEAILKSLD